MQGREKSYASICDIQVYYVNQNMFILSSKFWVGTWGKVVEDGRTGAENLFEMQCRRLSFFKQVKAVDFI